MTNVDFSKLEDKVLLDFLMKKQREGFDKGQVQPCPRCLMNELDKDEIMNSTSRLNNNIYICNDCGNDEAFADIGMFPLVRAREWEIFKLGNGEAL